MFHLFSGICLYPDIHATRFDSSYIISKFEDYDDYKQEIIDHMKSALSTSEMIDSFVDHHGDNPTQWFQTLYSRSHEQCSVYADAHNYAVILCYWVKALFKNIDAKSAYILYKLSVDRWYIRNVADKYPKKIFDFLLIGRQTASDKFKYLDQKAFTEVYNSVPVDQQLVQFAQSIKQEVSTEYQIVNHLNGNDAFDDMLKYQIQNAITTHVIHCLHDLLATTYWHLYDDGDVLTEFKTKLQQSKAYDIIASDVFSNWRKQRSFTGTIQVLNAAIDQLTSLHVGLYWDDKEVQSAKRWIELLTDDTTTDQLVKALFDSEYEQFICYNDYLNTVNVLALYYLHNLDSKSAKKYLIE